MSSIQTIQKAKVKFLGFGLKLFLKILHQRPQQIFYQWLLKLKLTSFHLVTVCILYDEPRIRMKLWKSEVQKRNGIKRVEKNVSRLSSTLILKEEKLGTKWIFFAKISNLRSSRFFDIFHYSIKLVYTLHTFSMVLFWHFLWFYNLQLKVLP